MCTYVFKVKFYDSSVGEEDVDYCAINADSAGEAAEEVECFYEDNLISFECTLIDTTLLFITEDKYNDLTEGY